MVWWKMAKKCEIPVHSEENMGHFFWGACEYHIYQGGFLSLKLTAKAPKKWVETPSSESPKKSRGLGCELLVLGRGKKNSLYLVAKMIVIVTNYKLGYKCYNYNQPPSSWVG